MLHLSHQLGKPPVHRGAPGRFTARECITAPPRSCTLLRLIMFLTTTLAHGARSSRLCVAGALGPRVAVIRSSRSLPQTLGMLQKSPESLARCPRLAGVCSPTNVDLNFWQEKAVQYCWCRTIHQLLTAARQSASHACSAMLHFSFWLLFHVQERVPLPNPEPSPFQAWHMQNPHFQGGAW